MNILVSACLFGCPCRYDGKDNRSKEVLALKERYQMIPVCPESLGGLPTPRISSEKRGDEVFNKEGENVTSFFLKGAMACGEMAKKYHCQIAILKERSPSCGCGEIYDGNFSKTLIKGDGITAAYLKQMGIRVLGETKLKGL